jgi:hypothetical protein
MAGAEPPDYDHRMPALLPTPFLFRFLLPVPYRDGLPADLDEGATLPLPATLDEPRLAEILQLRAAWNADGLAFCARVRGRTRPPQGTVVNPLAADGLQLWIDTRATQNVHRASRFCHHFCLLATGGGVQLPIPRAREESPRARPGDLQVTVERHKHGYDLTAWIPEKALHGFDPDASPRLGFYARLRDSELGDRYLTVGPEFPFATDPSVWSTLELSR